ncbi:receptor subunit 1 [Seminavis robusta]|uniref:Receptor subunit 1 n=1 Tax=Seminavis robusta TaxID=568900 RepID=A0A9N8DN66_9STRA|nr:receptor subunit 1 [Seminavis robusta]|eukprot:Sro171_g075730.1 receptor subunit 1 (625) ;mRNA; r:29018-30892
MTAPRPMLHCLCCLLVIVHLPFSFGHGLGDKAAFNVTPSLISNSNSSVRQDVCERYEKYRLGEIELKNALSGLALRPVFVGKGNPYFRHNMESGLPTENPGLIAELMDAVAARANFTWRDSFGVTEWPQQYNMTWTELLVWSTENYDIAAGSWDLTVERMEDGISYAEPWYDGSLILIDQRRSLLEANGIDLLNWTKPFDPAVWGTIILTVVFSALVYQLIEHLHGERDDRSLWQWFSDNLYLSAINFSQNYEYAPSSFAGRIFGVSMTIWALVITATYTANLASLFVEQRVEPVLVASMEAAVVYGYPVCTYEDTAGDFHIQKAYPKALREPRVDEKATYESLRNGECALSVSNKETWLNVQNDKEYNPDCNLEVVGDVVKPLKSAFAVKVDSGHLCSSLVRHVVSLHMVELVDEGVLAELWRKHRELADNQHCNYVGNSKAQPDRRLQSHRKQQDKTQSGQTVTPKQRVLKGGGASAAGGSDGDNIEAATLTLQQMAGTFIVHWVAMAVAVFVGCITAYTQKLNCCLREGQIVEKVNSRTHGPVIGSAPRVNTYVVRHQSEGSLDNSGAGSRQERARLGDEDKRAKMVAKQNALEAKIDEVEVVLNAKMDTILRLLLGQQEP